jgi:hypothetical protein
MLAYVFWHRPAERVDAADYEQALQRFHRSLARMPPSGLIASASLRAESLPWLGGDREEGYEDWYLLENWSSVGVLEVGAVSRGHESAHHEAARRSGAGTAAIYRLIEGEARPADCHLAVWVDRPAGHGDPTIADLLDDGVAPEDGSLWQRALVLGPAPEFCLLNTAPQLPPDTGVGAERLPAGWRASAARREPLPG